MKQQIIDFFKNKFNLTLIIIQVVAVISYCLAHMMFFLVLFFMLESSFFIVWGAKVIHDNRKALSKLDLYEQLPYTDAEKATFKKSYERNSKNNKFMAVMLIVIGIVLLFSCFSVIF